jgi:phospholipase/carboxylesterase
MIRLPSLSQTSAVPYSSTLVATWSDETYTRPVKRHGASIDHSLAAPIHYEPNYSYPLVVWLHGDDSSEMELQQVMPLVSVRNYVGVAPRGTNRVCKSRRIYSWRQTAGEVADACQRVRECVEIAQDQFNVHADRIFVAGHGAGGTMALRVGMENPELFAGAISLSGRVPRGANAFRRIKDARRLPIMLSVSPTEGHYTSEQVKEDLRLLHCGGFNLTLRLYPEGDMLTDHMFADVDSWIMEHFCPTAITA